MINNIRNNKNFKRMIMKISITKIKKLWNNYPKRAQKKMRIYSIKIFKNLNKHKKISKNMLLHSMIKKSQINKMNQIKKIKNIKRMMKIEKL